jgi:DNA-binding winged helix-turn-helix (wHTH) protein
VAANAVSQPPLRFDLFELDPCNFELRRRGAPVGVPPQSLRILLLLAVRPNELITRKEIKDALWPGQSYGDFDSRLNFAIKKLREVLDDDAERPRYVQTVRNAGYRFIATVSEVQPSELSATTSQVSPAQARNPEAHASSSSGQRVQFGKRGAYLLAATFFIALVAITLLALRRPRPTVADPEQAAARLRAADSQPSITSVTPIIPAARQRIVIRGDGFGLHVPYARTDSPYLAVRDATAHWAAGRLVPHNWDEVMVDVESWTDTELVISGFSGDYGKGTWKLTAGDQMEIAVWNPQNGVGPALYHTKVIANDGR